MTPLPLLLPFHRPCAVLALAACAGALLAAGVLPGAAHAQAAWPNAPIRMVVPFAPGAANDAVGRIIAAPMSSALGTPILVDNRPGAGGNLGAEIAARAPADGFTLFLANVSHATSASMYDKLGYDLQRDFAPVSLIGSGSYFLVTHPSLPVKSFKELVAFARARPGQLNVGSAGAGSYLWIEMLMDLTGTRMTHIAYKGTPQVATAVLGGEIALGAVTTVVAAQQVKSGRLRGQVVSSPHRSTLSPEVPTVLEAGYRELEATTWYGLLVPAATPKEIVNRLHAEAVRAMKLPEVRERFDNLDIRAIGSSPAEFGAFIRDEVARWSKVVKQSGAKPA
ncbi:MAG: tripartite tricarboxylate transporter substrate binding protein [Rhodocyclaceae bacterium]|nr:tripartite tricarboxylate transporter substrate binding protein [Rhodocyclaceae bacterium]